MFPLTKCSLCEGGGAFGVFNVICMYLQNLPLEIFDVTPKQSQVHFVYLYKGYVLYLQRVFGKSLLQPGKE